ncbi:MAG: DNA polymerase III subunit delta [Myxococcales bacterium]|nr:DNA polymerase III subunit delta [Myxococcales bacterium]
MSARALDGKAPVYLIHGEEDFLARQVVDGLKGKVLAGGIEDFNLDRFDGRERPDPERIAQAARTLPMMAPRRLVLVRNAEGLFAGGKGTVKPLLAWIEAPDATACIVFHAHGRMKRSTALYKAIEKAGVVHEAGPPREHELPAWITGRFKARGRRVAADGAAMLAQAVGRDLSSLDAAVERLCLFVEGDGVVQAEHVEQTVAHTRARTVWELVDAVADRDASQALARAHALLDQGERALGLLNLVVRQFRQLLLGRGALVNGASPDQAAAAAGIPSFRVRAFVRQVERYQGRELLDALDRLAAADRALKGSKVPEALIFEGLILDLCAPR